LWRGVNGTHLLFIDISKDSPFPTILYPLRQNGECDPGGALYLSKEAHNHERKNIHTVIHGGFTGYDGICSPGGCKIPGHGLVSLWDDDSGDPEDGRIEIDLAHANYATRANVGEQNKKLYYELKAYNPSGIPPIVTWGMVQAPMNGSLLFKGKFDSITLAWIESYGLTGATFSIKRIQPI
jgi:hypothetical protein